ncbi:MAG TPA: hypothetical protein VLB01_05270 [Thermodesulfobacteriota bacterium]|nr:hypothetical protein [Thermodesulfobacteriota bacterium]
MQRRNNPVEEKGLMDRRASFAQESVPNAHKGTDPTAKYVMLAAYIMFAIASFILARLTV